MIRARTRTPPSVPVAPVGVAGSTVGTATAAHAGAWACSTCKGTLASTHPKGKGTLTVMS